MSKVMKCNGQYIANSPCYPLCPNPDGDGCDTSSIFGGGGGWGGPTDNYSVTTGNAVTGNTSTRTNVSMIDPYQSITPNMLNASGAVASGRAARGRDELWFNQAGQSRDLWFNQSGDAVIKVGGDTYSYEPVLTWDRGCDSLDESGDGIFPNSNCKSRSKFGGVDGLKLGAYRFKNGVMDN
jgi:hypothetical protein|tara:strand:+ start:520 stop:1062 length:543 start_codon:yes stop_codon:yes gene_type:complete